MSWIDSVENQLKAHANAAKGIETIANLVRVALAAGGETGAADTLGTVLSVAEAVIGGLTGASKPEDVTTTLDKFRADIDTADKAADAEADRRFDHSEQK